MAEAATFQCGAGDVSCLIASITAAHSNGQQNAIILATGTYTLTTVHNTTDGPNGLPSITGQACPRRDQLGARRGHPCDIGAIEFQEGDEVAVAQ